MQATDWMVGKIMQIYDMLVVRSDKTRMSVFRRKATLRITLSVESCLQKIKFPI